MIKNYNDYTDYMTTWNLLKSTAWIEDSDDYSKYECRVVVEHTLVFASMPEQNFDEKVFTWTEAKNFMDYQSADKYCKYVNDLPYSSWFNREDYADQEYST